MTFPIDGASLRAGTRSTLRLAAFAALFSLGACTADAPVVTPNEAATAASHGGDSDADDSDHGDRAQVRYGKPVRVGNGHARTYVILDAARRHPTEVGVALDERALQGLPGANPDGGAHGGMTEYLLELPNRHGTPFNFVELDWNAMGHEPPGIYDLPHFDFHFYTVGVAERNAIVPSDPQYGAKAGNFPAPAFRFPFYVDPVTASGGAPAGAVAVPRMGMHWVDVRSPELQNVLGNPAGYRPFTTTFIYGSWDGRFIFAEPMITRDYILAKRTATDAAVRDEVIPVPTAAQYAPAGLYPSAYRIAWNSGAREYRIALTALSYHD